jgi:hypothetical protein
MNTKKFAKLMLSIIVALVAILGIFIGLASAQAPGPLTESQVTVEVIVTTSVHYQPTMITDTQVSTITPGIYRADLAFQATADSPTWVRFGQHNVWSDTEEWAKLDTKVRITGTSTLEDIAWMSQQPITPTSRTISRTIWYRSSDVVSTTAWPVLTRGDWDSAVWSVPASVRSALWLSQTSSITPVINGQEIVTWTAVVSLNPSALNVETGSVVAYLDTNVFSGTAELHFEKEWEGTYDLYPGQVPATGVNWLAVGAGAIGVLGLISLAWRRKHRLED